MTNGLCGDCLHAREVHIENNGHFMQCASCQKLCSLEEYNTNYSPSSVEIISKIQFAREYSVYIPGEQKKILQLENKSRHELTERYSND